MLQSMTAVLEQNARLDAGEFTTEPYEVAWASEARWFIYIEDRDPGLTADVVVEVSPEGITWCALPGIPASTLGNDELTTVSCRDFGGWLRLRLNVRGEGSFKGVRIYLALKG